jgi:hypothetical protein
LGTGYGDVVSDDEEVGGDLGVGDGSLFFGQSEVEDVAGAANHSISNRVREVLSTRRFNRGDEVGIGLLSHDDDQHPFTPIGQLDPPPNLPNVRTGKDVPSDGRTEQTRSDHTPERRFVPGSSARDDAHMAVITSDDPVLGIDQEVGPDLRESLAGFEGEVAGVVDDVLVHGLGSSRAVTMRG